MMPLPGRFLTSVLLRRDGELFLFDCGEGTQVSLKMLNLSWKKISSIRKICADAKSAVHVTSPVRDAPNTALTVLPKYTGNRRQPTPEKRGRA